MQIWRNDKESYLINIINIKLINIKLLKFKNKRKSRIILEMMMKFSSIYIVYIYIYNNLWLVKHEILLFMFMFSFFSPFGRRGEEKERKREKKGKHRCRGKAERNEWLEANGTLDLRLLTFRKSLSSIIS